MCWCLYTQCATMQVDILISPTEKCNIDDRWRSRAATGERPPSCGSAGGFPVADQWSQYLPGALQPFHHGCTTGRLSQLVSGHWVSVIAHIGSKMCLSFYTMDERMLFPDSVLCVFIWKVASDLHKAGHEPWKYWLPYHTSWPKGSGCGLFGWGSYKTMTFGV